MYIAGNIKLLRKRCGKTQAKMAITLKMKRPTLSGYENGVAIPGIQQLIAYSDYFGISIHTLIMVDLSKLKESELQELESGNDIYINGTQLRVLATTVDKSNKDNIELVPGKASAGYTAGYSDPEYVKELEVFNLPFLSPEKKYRTFQIIGDSMLPVPSGAWVTGEYLHDWNQLKDGEAYIILTLDEGVIFKIVENNIQTEEKIHLISLNKKYEPYDLHVAEIREIWKFVNFISEEMPNGVLSHSDLAFSIDVIKKDISFIKKRIEERY